jgi:hypothetical protein
MARIEQRLASLGLTLPPMPPPDVVLPFPRVRVFGDRALMSGHGPPGPDGAMAKPLGRVGADRIEQQGYAAARLTGLSIIASLKEA